MNALHFIPTYQARIEKHLKIKLSTQAPIASELLKAMQYSLLNGGKRLRALLVYASGLMLKVPLNILDDLAAAIECIHSFSLIHDDLPAMDNSDLRRKKPACHKQFNEALAILAGDALQSFAFEIIAHLPPSELKAEQTIKMIRVLSKAIGAEGMAGGQALDMQRHTSAPTEAHLFQLHRCKTGALINASVELSVYAAKTPESVIQCFTQLGQSLGLAFQIQDDILDHTGTTQQLGKTAHCDQANEKYNFIRLFGLKKAQAYCNEYYEKSRTTLEQSQFDQTTAPWLYCLLDWLQQRDC